MIIVVTRYHGYGYYKKTNYFTINMWPLIDVTLFAFHWDLNTKQLTNVCSHRENWCFTLRFKFNLLLSFNCYVKPGDSVRNAELYFTKPKETVSSRTASASSSKMSVVVEAGHVTQATRPPVVCNLTVMSRWSTSHPTWQLSHSEKATVTAQNSGEHPVIRT